LEDHNAQQDQPKIIEICPFLRLFSAKETRSGFYNRLYSNRDPVVKVVT